MEIDVLKCPGGIGVFILLTPAEIEEGKAALADPHRREGRSGTENLIIALLDIGAIK